MEYIVEVDTGNSHHKLLYGPVDEKTAEEIAVIQLRKWNSVKLTYLTPGWVGLGKEEKE